MLPAPLADYLEAMAGGASCLPPPLLESLHAALRHLEARGALLAAARFVHFGSLVEYPAALAEVIDARLRPFYAQGDAAPPVGPLHAQLWGGEGGEGGEGVQGGVLLLNCGALSIDGMGESPNLARRVARREWPGSTGGTGSAMACIELGEGCSLRLSDGFHLCVGLACVADLGDEATAAGGYSLDLMAWPLPEGLCLDGRALSSAHGGDDERVLLVYSSTDSFKRAASLSTLLYCGQPMEAWLQQRGLSPADLWSEAELQAEQQGQGIELWVAKLFCVLPPSPAAAELVAGYYAAPPPGWAEQFRGAARLSLGEVNARTSPQGRDATRQQLRRKAGAS
tara:strand:+ start:90 stop:1106 length:1017 start_codon:yes stop_codon:yes gene_type:complete